LIGRKILHSAADEVSEAVSVHMVPSAIQIVVIPAGVTILLLLHNPPRSWTGTVGPPYPAVCHRSFPAQPVGTPRLDSTMYYPRPYPYRLMVVLFSWVVAP
jgi:hypothetical protein